VFELVSFVYFFFFTFVVHLKSLFEKLRTVTMVCQKLILYLFVVSQFKCLIITVYGKQKVVYIFFCLIYDFSFTF